MCKLAGPWQPARRRYNRRYPTWASTTDSHRPLTSDHAARPPWRLRHRHWYLRMPSFDIVSELDLHEVTNAVDQASREVDTRFDFKGTNAKFELKGEIITLTAQADFQLQQMLDILKLRLTKRGVDVLCMKVDEPVMVGQTARQQITLRQGVDSEFGKKLQRMIKDSKLKVQAALQDKQVRVTGKSRDDLQAVMRLMRGAELELPLQFTNFRD